MTLKMEIISLISIVWVLLILEGPSCTSSDNFALLGGTLKTMQRVACDEQMVSLACPTGTTISIQLAQHGEAALDGYNCIAKSPNSQAIDAEVTGQKCQWPNSIQYSLLQTVVEACQKKQQCKFSTKPKPGLVVPCPATRKYVEVAYKCRPNEFLIKTTCEDDVIRLVCNPYSRVAVFDAQYGRTSHDPITCPQPKGVHDETCSAQHTTETVMQICHGKRRCSITANNKTFGSPCNPASRTYLKVIYNCVPLGVLQERYESTAEKDEVLIGTTERDKGGDLFDDSGVGEKWGETNIVPPIADPALQPIDPIIPEVDTKPAVVTKKTTMQDINHSDSNSESPKSSKWYLYVGIGVFIFIILVITLIGVRCYIIRRSSRHSKTGDMFTTEPPNVFSDTVSDVDNDIDVSHISGTFYDPVHPDMILYRDVPGSKGTLRAMRPLSTIYPCAGVSMYGNVDFAGPAQSRAGMARSFSNEERSEVMSPKSLGRYSNSQFYYG